MLLSDDTVSSYLDKNFILAWNTIRPAPKVSIDFGNGHTLERTLKGNTCFYVLRPDGKVVDALPGVYLPEAFLAELEASLTLIDLPEADILSHHSQTPLELGNGPMGTTLSKLPVQAPLIRALEPTTVSKAALQSPLLAGLDSATPSPAGEIVDLSALPLSADEIAPYLPGEGDLGERALRADSASSLAVLRPAIHQWLGDQDQLKTPAEVRGPIFKDILKVDIDDPYLGLKVEGIPGTD